MQQDASLTDSSETAAQPGENGQSAATPAPTVQLACVEICNFRRIAKARLELDPCTTVLVGANNSGKTSLLLVLRNFLSASPSFRAFDISISQWGALRELGATWESLEADPTTDDKDIELWTEQHEKLLSCMPSIDLWFEAKEGAYHYVRPFITTLKWTGGPVGVRLRLEPAQDLMELRKLAWRYCEARKPVRKLAKEGHAWPTDLLDYWLKHSNELRTVAVYRLDPKKRVTDNGKQCEPQPLPEASDRIELKLLRRLVRVDFVPAQRGLGAEDEETRTESSASRPGLFSNQLVKFAHDHLNVDASSAGQHESLITAIAHAQATLDGNIKDALKPAMKDVRKLGYPGLHDPQDIHFRTRIRMAELLAHSTAVQYRVDEDAVDEALPEHSIGLGYQNLQSLSFMLVSFRAARLAPPEGGPAAVHLVMVEEPEAHLHVQVQRCFSTNAHKLITPTDAAHSHLRTQLLISTHSSHLAHGNSFTRLRYLKRLPAGAGTKPCTEVINLGDAFGTDVQTRTFAERYFQVQHTDLLFADAAIFVEGTAERMLVPLFIGQDFAPLGEKYISYLDIGGSHAHRLQPLVERLGIPTVVITDVDPVEPFKTKNGRDAWRAVHFAGQQDLKCGNSTLNSWHPKLASFVMYATPSAEHLEWTSETGGKVRFAWQVPIVSASNMWPSSFEDALVLSNIDWFKSLDDETEPGTAKKVKHVGALRTMIDSVIDHAEHKDLLENLHATLHSGFSKADFAGTLFERMNNGAKLTCPPYIADALAWLSTHLGCVEKNP